MDGRAYESLTREHLDRLADIARRDREELFQRHPHLMVFIDRVLTVGLCQGGALHYVDGCNGVKDLDVWTLYAAYPDVRYPYRRRGKQEFGPSELSGWSQRVDLLGRSLPYPIGHDPIAVWQNYLGKPPTRTARLLATKAVVILEPVKLRGQVVWFRGGPKS
jgi:hypothetical protein